RFASITAELITPLHIAGTKRKNSLSKAPIVAYSNKTVSQMKPLFLVVIATVVTPFGLSQSYLMSTFAGSNRLLDGHAAKTVPLRYPYGSAEDSAGNAYFADNGDNRIRKVDPNGIISTIAGNGRAGFSGDNGQAINAELDGPQGIRLDTK